MSGLKILSIEPTPPKRYECIQCGDWFRELIIGLFCSERCEKRYFQGKFGPGTYNKVWIRTKLLKRSRLCGICLEPILLGQFATIDHIMPLSKGGSDAAENMQLAHKWCNEAKGNEEEG